MRADEQCYDCALRKVKSILKQEHVDEEISRKITEEVRQYLSQRAQDCSAPELMGDALQIVKRNTGIRDAFEQSKQHYNQLLLSRYEELKAEAFREKDPLYAGMQMALLGNYIDFGAMDQVEESTLESLLKKREEMQLSGDLYEKFRQDLAQAKKIVYITDNAGEIVLDRLFVELILREYPGVEICILVRGEVVLNDATLQDGQMVGFPTSVSICSNGLSTPGTPLERLSSQVRSLLEQADLCIAKGQGNFESLSGCGRNLYYLFLCKCDLFVKRFQVDPFAPYFGRERDLYNNDKKTC